MTDERSVKRPSVIVTLKDEPSCVSFLNEISKDDKVEGYSLRSVWITPRSTVQTRREHRIIDTGDVKKVCSALLATGEFDFIKEKLSTEEIWKLLLFVSYIFETLEKEEK